MSQVRVSGNASGTGVLTVTSPNTNSNYTLTLPAETGTILTTATAGVPINGPAFSAYPNSGQTLTAGTSTKILFQTELYDTASAYDTSTSRFSPTVAGYYSVSCAVRMPSSSVRFILEIQKNGTIVKSLQDLTDLYAVNGSCIIYMNGAGDYLEVYLYTGSTGSLAATAPNTFFEGALIRSAT